MTLPDRLRRLTRRVLPPPRRALSRWGWLHPVVFVALFAGVVGWLFVADRMSFARPAMLGLVALAGWLWWMTAAGHGGLPRGRATAALWVRFLLLAGVAVALAEPRSVRVSDGLSVVYVVDTSDSIGEGQKRRSMEFVLRTAAEKPPGDRAGLVAFGRNAAVELPPRNAFPYEALNAEISGDATDIEAALSLAAALLPDEDRGRIVLVSDGTATLGDVDSTLDELKSREIAVDTLPVQYDHNREAWVERLELPDFVKIGESYNASVLVSTLQDETGTLTLTENGREIGQVPVELTAGKNRVQLPLRLREAGYYEYEARLSIDAGPPTDLEPEGVPHDFLEANNRALGSIFVKGRGRVMLVIDGQDDDSAWAPLAAAIQETERILDVVENYDVPADPLAMQPYDCVIFCNVGRDLFNRGQIDAVSSAVFDQGAGFLMVGGPNSFGAGGWSRSPIEELLPVSLDVSEKKILPKGALAIVLHTCEFPEGNTWAKRITKEAIRVLSKQDEVGVLAYVAGSDQFIVPMQPAANYEAMVPAINGALIGDMPAFGPAMSKGLIGLKGSDASAKHVIIISDGDPQPPAPPLLKEYVDQQISCSMVSIFPHGGAEVATMRQIAGATGGRYYSPTDPNELPGIFIKESKTLRRNLIQKGDVTPEVALPSPILRGLGGPRPIEAYVLTSRKERSEDILLAAPPGDEAAASAGELDPILSLGRFGLGTTAAFTGDLTSRWSPAWVQWSNYRAFVGQLLTRISRTSGQQFLRTDTVLEGGNAVITVEDFHPEEQFLDVRGKIAGPRDRVESVTFRQTGPRRYQATVPLWGKGRYRANVVGGSAGEQPRTERVTDGWVLPYSPEYLRFESDPITLKKVREVTAGKELSGTATGADVWDRKEPKRSSRPIFDWLLAAVALLLPLDVAMRRVQLDLSSIRGVFSRRGTADGPRRTTEQLLVRSRQREHPRPASTRPPVVPVREAAPPPRTPTAASSPPPKDAGEPSDSAASTREKLLALKRRRDEES